MEDSSSRTDSRWAYPVEEARLRLWLRVAIAERVSVRLPFDPLRLAIAERVSVRLPFDPPEWPFR